MLPVFFPFIFCHPISFCFVRFLPDRYKPFSYSAASFCFPSMNGFFPLFYPF
ncbi:PTS glucitol/sorbitol transporter subunit IIC [Pasteurella multocida]|uniref:PTS glucitol/sorbitol transporter subunit IIC n=1 Tax=Pasteurella multocida TaxID=747 RepID=UPI0034E28CDB